MKKTTKIDLFIFSIGVGCICAFMLLLIAETI